MSLMHSRRDAHLLLLIGGSFTIFEVAHYKPQLLAALEQAEFLLELDLSEVDEIDTAGLQLLLLMRQEAMRQSKQCLFSQASAAVQKVLDLLHLQIELLNGPALLQESP